MVRKGRGSLLLIGLSICLFLSSVWFILADDPEVISQTVDILDHAEWLDIPLDEVAEISALTVVEVNERNVRSVLDALGIRLADKRDVRHIDNIYTIYYQDGASRIHIIDYGLISSGFERTYDAAPIFKENIRRGTALTQGAFDTFRENKTTTVKGYKYVQIFDADSQAFSTVIIAKSECVYAIQFVEGLDEEGHPYSYLTKDKVSDTSTPHYADNAHLKAQALQYVHDFGFGTVWVDV